MNATGTYKVTKWDEQTLREHSPSTKSTRASVVYTVAGEIDGTAHVEYLMFYTHFDASDQHKSSAAYVGLILFEGKLAGKSGSFVLEDKGTFGAGIANSTLGILEGSGSGALEGIRGTGGYRASRDAFLIELEYTLP